MPAAREKLIMRSTNLVELTGLKDRVTGEYPDNATVTADLLNAEDESAVAGGDGLAVEYSSGTGVNSTYYGRVPHTVTLVEDAEYIIRVEATWDDGVEDIVRTFDIDCYASRR
jgi:hypothetical protein